MRVRAASATLVFAALLIASVAEAGVAFAQPAVRVFGPPPGSASLFSAAVPGPSATPHRVTPARASADRALASPLRTQLDVSNVAIDFISDQAWVMGTVRNQTGAAKQTVRVYVDGSNGSTIVGSWFDFVPSHAIEASGDTAPFMVYLGNSNEVMAMGITDWNIEAWGNDDRYPYMTFPGATGDATWTPSAGPWPGTRLTVTTEADNVSTTAATFPSSSWAVTATVLGTDFLYETFGGFNSATRIPASSSATLTATMHWTFSSGTTAWTMGGHMDARMPSDVRRVSGTTRYDTAAALSRDAFASATDVVLVTGQDYADALSAAALAGAVHGPVLLTTPNTLSPATATEIQRLGATGVYIIGGTGAVSNNVYNQLGNVPGIARRTRLSGTDRYATAGAVAVKVRDLGGDATHPFLARGDDFADALGLGPLAYASQRPILLTKPASVPSATAAAVATLGVTTGMVAGGSSAVSTAVADQVYGAGDWYRVAGADRYETAVRVAEMGVRQGWVLPNRICVASGTGFADGLAAGSAAGAQDGLVLLTRPASADASGLEEMRWFAPFLSNGRIAGGTGAVSTACYNQWVAAMTGQ
jgi:putative cell wall-binding protein